MTDPQEIPNEAIEVPARWQDYAIEFRAGWRAAAAGWGMTCPINGAPQFYLARSAWLAGWSVKNNAMRKARREGP
jgi:hypothetical protein